MKIFGIGILLIYISLSVPKINADIESDLDYELFKHLDVSPIHTSFNHDVDDFDEPYSTFDSTYDGGGTEDHDDNEEDNNDQSDNESKKNGNDSAAHGVRKNSGDYDDDDAADDSDDDDNAENDRTENDDADDDDSENNDDDDEEETDETKLETSTIKAIDPKGSQTVDPESFHYISPDDVSHRLSREKRSKKSNDNDDDFARSYREFVREHFGVDDAKTLSDDNKKKKKQENDEDNDDDNGEAEEDEDYEEGAEDGDTEDGNTSNQGATASASADDYYDDDNSGEEDDENNKSGSNEDEDYKKVKKLSQDGDENPEFCKVVYKDNQECQVCKNPKTHDKSETCSYSSSPTPKRYAYKKEKNYHSNDDYGDPEDESDIVKRKKNKKKSKAKKPKRNFDNDYDEGFSSGSKTKKAPKSKKHSKKNKRSKANKKDETLTGGFQPSPFYYGYQDRRTQTPLHSHYLDENDDDLLYKGSESLPVTVSGEMFDKDIFNGRDWSQCNRKINKEGLTCYYCKDTHGATQEECMYIAGNDEENPLKRNSNKKSKSIENKKSKRIKKTSNSKKYNSNNGKTTTTTTTTTTTPKTIVTTPKQFDSRNFNQNSQDQNKLNFNLNTAPKTISSVSWQTNHNYNKQPRILNRNQNFNRVPIPLLNQNININPLRVPYEIDESVNSNKNIPVFKTTLKSSDPVKTLEYTEPRNRETLKRMIKLKIVNDTDSDKPKSTGDNDATVFYSKVLRKY